MFKALNAWGQARAAWGVRNQFLSGMLSDEEVGIVIHLASIWEIIYEKQFGEHKVRPDLLYVVAYFFDNHVKTVRIGAEMGVYPSVPPDWVRMLALGAILLEGHVTRHELQVVINRLLHMR